MGKILQIHEQNPQRRLLQQAADVVLAGGVIVYPTDSGYALGCKISEKEAMERMRAIRSLPPDHHFTLVCRDLSEIATYARVDNPNYRLLKKLTPGAYTFLLPATKEVPRRLQHPKRKTIGIRVPNHKIALELLEVLQAPLISTTLMMPGDTLPLVEVDDIDAQIGHRIDLLIDGGYCGVEPTSVVDLYHTEPVVVRKGAGDVSLFTESD